MSFTSAENIDLLWGVIQKNKQSEMSYLSHCEQMNYFFSVYRENTSLMEMNKKYIAYIVQFIKTNQSPEKKLEPYTIEEIQEVKRSQFNQELIKKQQEFSQYNTFNIPQSLKFNEDVDKPINQMEELISQTIAQRELDVAQIKKQLPPPPQPPSSKPRLITITDILLQNNNITPIQLDEEEPTLLYEENTFPEEISITKIYNQILSLDRKMDQIIQQLSNK